MIKTEEVVAVLSANGFLSQAESWKSAYDSLKSISGDYVGGGDYSSIDDLLDDMINGGSIFVPATVSKETVDVFALAASHVAQYQILATSSREWGDGVHVVWNVGEE